MSKEKDKLHAQLRKAQKKLAKQHAKLLTAASKLRTYYLNYPAQVNIQHFLSVSVLTTPSLCPRCRSTEISSYDLEGETRLCAAWTCKDCALQWREHYLLSAADSAQAANEKAVEVEDPDDNMTFME